MFRRLLATLTGALVALAPATAVLAAPSPSFVTRHGDDLYLNGKTFRFGGSNNYYLEYQSTKMVDDVFADAAAAGFTVLRHWGFLDIGNQDGSNSVGGKANGVYFQYWDGAKPAYNDGADGLEKLDYVLYAARRAGVKVIIPLTNNWKDFGGMDQYVRWAGGQYHDDFYTSATIRGWYKDWISHVLNRVNTLTGVAYRNDPTVMTWELGNEPRCKGSGVYPQSPGCTPQTLVAWADEMTRHIKSIDRNHLASVGDEGFFCDDPTSADWTTNCGEGVDTVALAKLPAVDVMSYHLYPDGWGKTAAWGTDWIKRHGREARAIGKPSMLGEFGILDKATRNVVYKQWTDAAIASGTGGFLYWILSGIQDDDTLYPDYDGFTVYWPSPVGLTLSNATDEIAHGQRSRPPVADDDAAVTMAGTPVTLTPAANDIAYRTRVKPSTIDLTGAGFALNPDGTVTYAPPDGFQGRATATYTIRDLAGRVSNRATITVTVKPPPGAPIRIASYESGTEGWASANWQTNFGALSQTPDFHTDGSFGLHLDAADGGWFGVTLPEPIDVSTKEALKYDVRTGADTGTSAAIAVQTGPGLAWCQSVFTWVPQNSDTTFTADLLSQMSCDATALADVRVIYLWASPGAFDIDNVRAE